MKWKTSFKVCLFIVVMFAVSAGAMKIFRSRADAKVITLSRDDLIEMNNLTLEESALRADYTAKMTSISARYQAIRKRANVPTDFVNDMAGNTIVGFRPETPEEKDKRAHPQQ